MYTDKIRSAYGKCVYIIDEKIVKNDKYVMKWRKSIDISDNAFYNIEKR